MKLKFSILVLFFILTSLLLGCSEENPNNVTETYKVLEKYVTNFPQGNSLIIKEKDVGYYPNQWKVISVFYLDLGEKFIRVDKSIWKKVDIGDSVELTFTKGNLTVHNVEVIKSKK